MRSRAGSLTVGGGIVDAYCSCIPSISSLLSICVACRSFLSIAFSLLPHNRAIIYHFRMTFIVTVNPFLFSWGIYSTPTASRNSFHPAQQFHLLSSSWVFSSALEEVGFGC
ncbi:hypothetical protein TNIN_367901 [Trichonephila inaurata madagascariensis]|uniref:Uncharacterized protein n=1 Tax=Trichonephila inaurata madagascariensis TaxID=2747483 RepID=A0A8X7BW64_9ARAC|nr:hypothetical protein TNIN_367901 [Trichonephila inaurata madagascariensis]